MTSPSVWFRIFLKDRNKNMLFSELLIKKEDAIAIESCAEALSDQNEAHADSGYASCFAVKSGDDAFFGLKTTEGERIVFTVTPNQLRALAGKRDVFGFSIAEADKIGWLREFFDGEGIRWSECRARSEFHNFLMTDSEFRESVYLSNKFNGSRRKLENGNDKIKLLESIIVCSAAIDEAVPLPEKEGDPSSAESIGQGKRLAVSAVLRKSRSGRSSSYHVFVEDIESHAFIRFSLDPKKDGGIGMLLARKAMAMINDEKGELSRESYRVNMFANSLADFTEDITKRNRERESIGSNGGTMSISEAPISIYHQYV